MKLIIRFLIVFAIIESCQNSIRLDQSQIKTFDLTKRADISSLKLSDLGFIDIEYIPLETCEENSIGHFDIRAVTHRFIADNNFFIIKQFNDILLFQTDGSFVSRIGTVGRGPEEYEVAHDIDVDKTGYLYLVSGFQEKFNLYSEDGKFIRSFKFPFKGPVQFRLSEEKIICYIENLQGNSENSFIVIDTLGLVLKAFPNNYPFKPYKGIPTVFGRENLFYKFNNRLFIKEVYSDTIYSFDKMLFKPHIVLATGDRLITPEARAQFDLSYLAENFIRPTHLFEFGDFVYYEYTYSFKPGTKNILYGFIGSKTTEFQAFIDADQGIINDLDGGPSFLPKTIKDNKTVISWIDAKNLKEYVASEDFKNSQPKYIEKKKELEVLADSIKETDNPILVLVSLKK
jgi:hypothetical protein